MKSPTHLLLPALFSLLLSACAWMDTQKDETQGWSAQKIYTEASGAMKESDYQKAIKYYEILEARYPFGKYATQTQLDVAYAYYKYEEPESALAAADRFIKLYPKHPNVDYAYYLKGLVNYNRTLGFFDRYLPTDQSQRDAGANLESFKDFEKLLQEFPQSPYSADARQRMIYLRNNMALHEIHIATYYMKRGAYLAAVNRAKYVIENFQRTTAVNDALEILIVGYTELGLPKLAEDARRVLDLNRQQGTIVVQKPSPEEVNLGQRIWDYLELDKN